MANERLYLPCWQELILNFFAGIFHTLPLQEAHTKVEGDHTEWAISNLFQHCFEDCSAK